MNDLITIHQLANWNNRVLSDSEIEDVHDILTDLSLIEDLKTVALAIESAGTKRAMRKIFRTKNFRRLANKINLYCFHQCIGRQMYDYEQFAYNANPHEFVITDGE